LNALYYPHTDIKSSLILKNALLLWDSIETIVPRASWVPERVQHNRAFNEAVDLIVKPRVPIESEMAIAHQALQGMIEDGIVAKLVSSAPQKWRMREYLIYPDKFLHGTWEMLKRGGTARWVSNERDYGVPAAVGYLMMSLLADACAGSRIHKVTDQSDAYAWLSQSHALALGSSHITGLDISQVAPGHDRLVALSVELLDARSISLEKLVEFRKRELRRGGIQQAAMRRRYQRFVTAYVARIAQEARSVADVRELEREFRQELKEDLAYLKDELKVSLNSLLSKDVAITTLAVAGALSSSIAGLTALPAQVGVVGVIPILKAAADLRGARRAAFQRHMSSWLYLAKRQRVFSRRRS
jgi:hypothetical protein